jgi:hypothetical protein
VSPCDSAREFSSHFHSFRWSFTEIPRAGAATFFRETLETVDPFSLNPISLVELLSRLDGRSYASVERLLDRGRLVARGDRLYVSSPMDLVGWALTKSGVQMGHFTDLVAETLPALFRTAAPKLSRVIAPGTDGV